ncbi:HalOD1 output domain-containing protein [Halosolutus amylolyticus]|uniref:HalOD1 output domain-containing protein n=1 Tax=Halosolutus amylolyticus TaxID=2932267 RepID=A0ABD5PTI5_9EURY|nr:HalOD1 output domain-containing protein [Halosolutus amylolyticus]
MGEDATLETDEPASHAVIRVVAAYTNRPPIDLKPLHDVIDVDALDALVSHAGDCVVRFRYEGLRVVVTGDGIAVTGE